jgi:hypothetical protein
MGWLVVEREEYLCTSCNKSFLFGGFSQHNNLRKTQQPVIGTTSTISFDFQFYFVDTSRVRDGSIPRYRAKLDFGLRKRTKQLTPSCLGFEASNPLKSLLLHCSNVVFNSIKKNQISGSREVLLLVKYLFCIKEQYTIAIYTFCTTKWSTQSKELLEYSTRYQASKLGSKVWSFFKICSRFAETKGQKNS